MIPNSVLSLFILISSQTFFKIIRSGGGGEYRQKRTFLHIHYPLLHGLFSAPNPLPPGLRKNVEFLTGMK